MNPLLIRRRGMMMTQAAGPQSGTLVVYPSSYDQEASQYNALENISNAYAPVTSSNYCTIRVGQYAGAVCFIYFQFDTSSIPNNAIIDNITCQAKVYANAYNRSAQMYSGNTAHGTASTWGNSTTTLTMNMGGAWTRAEVADISIKLYGEGDAGQNRYLRLYGATLTIEWHTN